MKRQKTYYCKFKKKRQLQKKNLNKMEAMYQIQISKYSLNTQKKKKKKLSENFNKEILSINKE